MFRSSDVSRHRSGDNLQSGAWVYAWKLSRPTFPRGDPILFHDSAFDRCIDDLSSTLELAEALERQLEQVHRTVSQACDQEESGDDFRS